MVTKRNKNLRFDFENKGPQELLKQLQQQDTEKMKVTQRDKDILFLINSVNKGMERYRKALLVAHEQLSKGRVDKAIQSIEQALALRIKY